MTEIRTLHLVFDSKYLPPERLFVEAETEDGKSVRVGEWIPDPHMTGYDVLKLRVAVEDIHAVNE